MNSLWPDDIAAAIAKTPLPLLQEQADFISHHTCGVIKGDIVNMEDSENNLFTYDFDLVVRTLKYRFTLFTVQFEPIGYPAYIQPYSKISDELGVRIHQELHRLKREIPVNDDNEMTEALRFVLGSTTTRQIVQTLLAQAKPSKSSH